MKIGNHDLSQDGVFIIAEAGVNHNGKLELAKQLVDAAKQAGAHAVKFQMYKADRLAVENAALAEYQRKRTRAKNQQEMLAQYELSAAQFLELKQYCEKQSLLFLATPFDLESAETLNNLNVEAFKVSSGDLNFYPLLKQLAGYDKPILLSTGMATISEIESAMYWLETHQALNRTVLLHCTSSYPAPFDCIDLKVIDTLRSAFLRPVGYSDHSEGLEIPIAAAALGYVIIEKHFTLNRNLEGPDHQASLEPNELESLVKAVKNTKAALGSSRKFVHPAEAAIKSKVRRGLYASKDLKKGQTLREEDVICLRPESDMDASLFSSLIGRTLRCEVRKYESFKSEQLL